MTAFPVYHTYINVEDFREYLAGSAYSNSWTADSNMLLRLAQRASRMIDSYIGLGSFGPTTETRLYDLGSGDLKYDPRPMMRTAGISTVEYRAAVVPFDRWLITASTVTADGVTLTSGLANDYLLEPYNDTPKFRLKLTEETSKTLSSGQQVLSVAGSWGWQAVTDNCATLDGAVNSTTSTSINVSIIHQQSPGETILVDSEQMFITNVAANTNTITVIRGVNGTTAATHSNQASVKHYMYPQDVQMACFDIARALYRDRDAGITESIGTTEQNMSRSSKQIADALHTLDWYHGYANASGLVF